MKAISGLIAALMIPFMLLNAFGGIVAGIWLAFLGEWSAIFLGISILFLGAFVVSLLLAPGMAVAGLGAMAIERGNRIIGWLFVLLASPWTYIVIAMWEIVIFNMFGKRVTPDNIIPMWIWSYGAATGVWSFLASKEQQGGSEGGGSAAAAAFSAQIAYIVLAVCRIGLGLPLIQTVVAMAVTLILPLAFGLASAVVNPRYYAKS